MYATIKLLAYREMRVWKLAFAVSLICGAADALPAQTFTTLASFSMTDGNAPVSSLIKDTDGNSYGTTFGGGSHNEGTIFKITPSGTLTVFIDCDFTNCGASNAPLLLGADGNFYGTTDGEVKVTTPKATLSSNVAFQVRSITVQ